MRRGSSSRLSRQLFALDLLLTPLALYGASLLRARLPFGQGGALVPEAVGLPWIVYLLAVISWGTGLLLAGVHQPVPLLVLVPRGHASSMGGGLGIFRQGTLE